MITQMAVVGGIVSAIGFVAELGGENEFSPFTLELRGRSLLYTAGIPVRRSRWTCHRDRLVDFLVTAGYWSPVEAADERWIPMSSFRGRGSGETALAFELHGNWVVWSAKHPDLARRLWPHVLKILRGPPLDYEGFGVVQPSYIAAGVLTEVRRVDNMPDLERKLKVFEDHTKPALGDKAPK